MSARIQGPDHGGAELELWVIYQKTIDCPNSTVVRRHVVAGGESTPDPGLPCIIAPSLERAREALEILRSGLRNLGRQPGDDPAIVEVWI